jgi:hypothetical protein
MNRPEDKRNFQGLTQYQRDAIAVLRARLDTTDPGFSASEFVRDAFIKAEPYLRSWVLPLLDVIAGADSYSRQSVARDAARIRNRRYAKEVLKHE